VSPRSTPGFSGISWVIDYDESLARSSVFTVYVLTVCTQKYLDWYIGSRQYTTNLERLHIIRLTHPQYPQCSLNSVDEVPPNFFTYVTLGV
jgi:hypothetical protein